MADAGQAEQQRRSNFLRDCGHWLSQLCGCIIPSPTESDVEPDAVSAEAPELPVSAPPAVPGSRATSSSGRISDAGPAENPSSSDDPMGVDASAGQDESLDQVLDAWATEEGQGEDENRQEAARRIRAWVAAGDVDEELSLSGLNLTRLPARLPDGLHTLHARGNQLTSLQGAPDGLHTLHAGRNQLTSLQGAPDGLHTLHASGNQLTSLQGAPDGLHTLRAGNNQLTSLQGAPDGLHTLHADGNQLTSLQGAPDGLHTLHADGNQLTSLQGAPDGLHTLDADGNQLTSLQGAPDGLQTLYAGRNQLTSLPEDLLLTRLGAGGTIDLEGNPLSERVRTNLAAVINAPGYAGPRVYFSMAGGQGTTAVRPLGDAAADWLGEDAETAAAWQGFAGEEGAPEYARFLDRLRGTVSSGNPEFRQAVVEDLRQAAARPRLRQKFFVQAFGATETCEDRVTLTWNGMQTARLIDDVEAGAYDDRLDELVPEARRLFRLDALDRIAEEKVQSLRFVDEIEVYLAYQVKLRERLDLRLVAPDMRFFGVSHVTEADLDAAEMQVRQEEGAEFAAYLATKWQPWETVVSRIAPEAHEAMQKRLVESMGEDFQARLAQRLGEVGLAGDADAERQLGAQVRAELAREIKGGLMRQVLRDKGLESLLDAHPTRPEADAGSLEALVSQNPEGAPFPRPEAQPSPFSNLPAEMIVAITEQVANEPDPVRAFYDLHHFLSTNRGIRSVALAAPTLRRRYEALVRETASQRQENAQADVALPTSSLTADEAIAEHCLTDAVAIRGVRRIAAGRDIAHGSWSAPDAIARHGVTDLDDDRGLRKAGAARDIDGGTPAPDAIARHGATDPDDDRDLRRSGADRDIANGALAPDAIARHGVTDDDQIITLGKKAALRDTKTGMTASEAVERNGVVRDASIADVRRKAAEWDIDHGKTAPNAIAWHGVTSTRDRDKLRRMAAERDIDRRTMDPEKAIKRHKVTRKEDLAALRSRR
ncbi:hypothetical protein FFK22_039985 [Mycobacterium sp. KBS0706]|nr:hypothetical protein FFK22_039985 [Mycobacterium sp. KBS0706]